jgi:hypothetical protein
MTAELLTLGATRNLSNNRSALVDLVWVSGGDPVEWCGDLLDDARERRSRIELSRPRPVQPDPASSEEAAREREL